MVPVQDTPARGRSPSRGTDDLDDDDWTVYSDSESIASGSSASPNFFPSENRQDSAPVFCLKKEEQDKPVYEAWNVYYYPPRREAVDGCKVLGVKRDNYEEVPARVELRRQPSTQSELAETHLHAIEGFQAKHKRSWPARALCGRGKTYEQHLDEKCKVLPRDVKTTVTDLLFDRGKATSTLYRTRTWTVAVMREQLQHRYAEVDHAEVKRHKLRFWKNPKADEHLLYTVVIRGRETKVAAGEEGYSTFEPGSNPWVHADNAEIRRRDREEGQRLEALRAKRRTLSPSFRARPPPFRRRFSSVGPRSQTRTRSVSPPSYRSFRSRYDSPPPSTRWSRYESPPPYRRYTRGESPARRSSRSASPLPSRFSRFSRSESPLPSRSPSVRIRVVPRYTPSFDDALFPPTPPESYTPPPGVSAYQRPGFIAPPFPAPYPRPHFIQHPPAPLPPWYTNPHPIPAPPPGPRPTPANCPSCRSYRLPPCAHHPRLAPCTRPVIAAGPTTTYHPACQQCMRQHFNLFTPPHLPPPPPPPPMMPVTPDLTFNNNPPLNQFGNPQHRHYIYAPPPPPPPPLSTRPPSYWFPGSSGSQSPVGPMPPAPNPFSPLSTPPLTSCGGGSPVLSSVSARSVRTPPPPVGEGEGEVEVRGEDGRRSPAASDIGLE